MHQLKKELNLQRGSKGFKAVTLAFTSNSTVAYSLWVEHK